MDCVKLLKRRAFQIWCLSFCLQSNMFASEQSAQLSLKAVIVSAEHDVKQIDKFLATTKKPASPMAYDDVRKNIITAIKEQNILDVHEKEFLKKSQQNSCCYSITAPFIAIVSAFTFSLDNHQMINCASRMVCTRTIADLRDLIEKKNQ